ncbi:MAG: hypothetical protein ABI528_04615 [bacterium]
MLKSILITIIVTAVFLGTLSNSYSQEKAISGSSELGIHQTAGGINPESKIFKLYSSRQTESNNVAIIQFELGEKAMVLLTVSDSKGTIIETLIDDRMDAGIYNVNFKSAKEIIAGEFTYKLEVKGISGIKNVFAVK